MSKTIFRFPQSVEINGVLVDPISLDEAVEVSLQTIRDNRRIHVVTPNPEMVVLSQNNEHFRNVLNSAKVKCPDGIGLQIAAELFSLRVANIPVLRELLVICLYCLLVARGVFFPSTFKAIPFRAPGSDLVNQLLQKPGIKFYFLGGGQGVAKKAAEEVAKKFPSISEIAFNEGGKINDLGFGSRDEEVIKQITVYKPHVLIVCFGAPRQDLWINNHLNKLPVNVAIGAGGTLDFIAGVQRRAPRIMRKFGLEWAWRLLTEPHRALRIWNATIRFSALSMGKKITMIQSGHDIRR